MRSPVDRPISALRRGLLTFLLAAGLSACGTFGGGTVDAARLDAPSALPVSGPSADYPVVIGQPYTIGGIEYVPTDSLNYDHVGYVALDEGAAGFTASSHVLPYPSYVEVTALDSGRTVLARVERRGPMTSNHLIALSPAALSQLGADPDTPVRVRRTLPPEDERALLRAGEAAPLRMDTPPSLLGVLQRRLPEEGVASLRVAAAPRPAPRGIEPVEVAASSATAELPAVAVSSSTQTQQSTPSLPPLDPVDSDEGPVGEESADDFAAAFQESGSSENMPPSDLPTPAVEGRFVVQAAAFASIENANRSAAALGGTVTQAGRFYRVRTGPFVTRGEAEASLANVRSAGYTDARILTGG